MSESPEGASRFDPRIAPICGSLFGITIVPRLPGEDVGDDELRWEPNFKRYIAGPVAWKVFTQLRELKLASPGKESDGP